VQNRGMSESERDPAEALAYFSTTPVVTIVTANEAGDEVLTPIWAVAIGDTPYIRSGYGEGSKWHARVERSGEAEFADGTARIPVTVEHVEDEAELAAVDAAYTAKYAGSAAPLAMMLGAGPRADTLRLTVR